jgi:nucleotide-binding universal stress UspA family protein
MYKTILVATSGFDFSEEALEKALAIAGQNNGQVAAVCVSPPITHAWALKDAMRREAEKVLDRVREFAMKKDVALALRIEEGYPFEGIVNAARKLGSDLIVMASHGHTRFRKMLVGSVTEQVIRTAPCPVLVVKKREVRVRAPQNGLKPALSRGIRRLLHTVIHC